jgi:hypothetical protein
MKTAHVTSLSVYIRPTDREPIERALALAAGQGEGQSALVVRLLREWLAEQEAEETKQ